MPSGLWVCLESKVFACQILSYTLALTSVLFWDMS